MARGIGDNGGPPLDPDESWRHWNWKRAHKRAWKTPPREIALRRLANAEALGMTYREYTLEIKERGRHPTERPVREEVTTPEPVQWFGGPLLLRRRRRKAGSPSPSGPGPRSGPRVGRGVVRTTRYRS